MMTQNGQTVKIDVSTLTIVKIVGTLLALWVAYLIREVFAYLFIALVFAALIDPLASHFQRRRISRAFAVLVVYLGVLGLVGLITVLLVPPIVSEFGQLVANLGAYTSILVTKFQSFRGILEQFGGSERALQQGIEALQAALSSQGGSIFSTLQGFFGNISALVLVLGLTFYTVVEREAVQSFFLSITPRKYHAYFADILPEVQVKMGAWLRGQVMLSATVGVLVYLGLKIIGVDYALVLAILAGLAEFVPFIGPITSAIPAVFFALASSPFQALVTAAMYIVIQWAENHILVPKIMQKATGINPIVAIVSFLVGAKLGGVVGAILAIPVATAIMVFTQDFFARQEKMNS